MTTSTYSGLESTFKKYKEKGFSVLAFPANNFGNQEPDSNEKIKKFCAAKGTTFDVLAKVSVKGEDQCDLYKFLTTYPDDKIAGDITWNFQKYLVGRDGKVLAKFSPRTLPTDKEVTAAIEKALDSDR